MPTPARESRNATDAEALLVEALFNATRTFRHRLRPALEGTGLTSPMFWTLHQLVLDGPLTVGHLADACVVTPANVSATAEQLEQAGLVARSSAPHDRRVVVLSPTARGRSAHRAVWTRLGRLLGASLSELRAADLDAATRVLAHLAGAPEAAAVVLEGSTA